MTESHLPVTGRVTPLARTHLDELEPTAKGPTKPARGSGS